MAPIEWHTRLEDSPTGRLFAYVFVGSLTGLPVLIALAVLVALPAILPALLASPSILVLVAVLTLVGGPLSLFYLWPLLTERDQRRPILARTPLQHLSTVGVTIASVGSAAVYAVTFVVIEFSPLLVLVGGALVGITGTWLLLTTGSVDPENRVLRVRPSLADRASTGWTVDLDTWTGLARYRLGPVTVLRPTYGPGIRSGVPRLLPMPTWVVDAAAPVFEAAIDAPTPEPDRVPNPAVAATFALFGLGIVALGVAAIVLQVGPAGYRLYLFALSGVFGGLFLVAAWREY